MWDLGSRAVIVSISVLSGCAFLYNAWGPILAVTVSLILVIYACYSLITNDSLLSPHAFLLFRYVKEALRELTVAVDNTVSHVSRYLQNLWHDVNRRSRFYHERFPRMERRHASTYQLSSESCAGVRSTGTGFGMVDQLSPIPRNPYKLSMNDAEAENKFYHSTSFGKHTSTPMFRRRKDDSRNGDSIGLGLSQSSANKLSPMCNQNDIMTRGENTYFCPNGSPWSSSVSPKMRPKAAGVKTVQTVAGPLLASTRYNIDPKVYADVTSPGLTTRLTKYATEANSKLTHQSQYGTGQFPKVNLNSSPVPLISAKSAKAKMPVTVRVAPPDTTRYSPPERQRILSNLSHMENKSPSVVQVLREISLKRHASREDVTSDLIKKQRTEGIFSKETESPEETKQKRSRDESSKSEDDCSPQNRSLRPAKRTKPPSCYDILNSLSSSIHVVSGVKRKAMDFSRSGTPDFEKHFKSLENAHTDDSETSPQSRNVDMKRTKESLNEIYSRNLNTSSSNKLQESSPVKGILKSVKKNVLFNSSNEEIQTDGVRGGKTTKNRRHDVEGTSTKSINLTDKLFMRAEPQRNEKLRSLVEEQAHIKARFTTDDVEEIKKEDIVNMRQTSMRARLQSMFDAISGKASRIDPDVVIQAEEVNAVTPITCSPSCATLNSSTTTTNINTTPISTSAIAPVLSTPDPNAKIKSTDRSTALPNGENPRNSAQVTGSINFMGDVKGQNASPVKSKASMGKTEMLSTASKSITSENTNVPLFSKLSSPNASITASTFTFGKPLTSPSTSTTLSVTPGVTSASNNVVVPTTSKTVVVSSPVISSNFSIPSVAANGPTSTSLIFGNTTTNSLSIVPNEKAEGLDYSTTKTVPDPSGTAIANVPSTVTTSSTNIVVPSTSVFTFGTSANTAAQPKKFEIPVFGETTPQAQSMQSTLMSNGATTCTTTNRNFASSNTTANTTMFGKNVNTTASTYGIPNKTSTFSFGTPSTSTTNDRPLFSFGTNTTSASSSTIGTSAIPVFGAPSNVNVTSAFSTPSTASTLQFGAMTTPIFGTTTATSTFGTTNPVASAFSTSKTVSIPVFGSNGEVAASSSSIAISSSSPLITSDKMIPPASISAPLMVPTATTTAVATITTINTTSTTGRSLFSNANVGGNANSTASTTSVFGTGTSTNIFDQTKSPLTFGTSTGAFGSGSTSLFGTQTTTASTFGTTATGSVGSAGRTFTFGTTNNTVTPTSFGTPSTGITGKTEYSTVQSFGTSSSVFGTGTGTAGSLFGAATTSAPASAPTGFGSSMPNTFGGQNTSNAFGTTSTANVFGDSNKPPSFGVQTTTASTAFGSGSSASTNLFTFGGGNKQSNASSLPQNTFSFRGNTTPAAGTAGSAGTAGTAGNTSTTGFQFVAPTSKPASTGFNFSTPSSTPAINFGTSGTPTFNASTPGMFNIGSGTTAPRSKNLRPRKPR